MKLIAVNQTTLTNLKERAIERTDVTFWHGLSATKHPLGVYDCGGRDHFWANEFNVTSGKTYTVRVIAKQTKGSIRLAGGIWYTAMTSGHSYDSYGPFALIGELSEDGLGVYEKKIVAASGKTKGKAYIQLEQAYTGGSTAYRIYDAQVFDENGQPLVTDQNNFGALTSPMAAPDGTYIWKCSITYYTDGTNSTVWEYSGVGAKGDTGAKGDKGDKGATGDRGAQGPKGDTGATGPQGPKGDKGATGDRGPQGIQGIQGPKGDQGIQGPKGADGKTQYTHIAYADNATGGGFSQTDHSKAYIGMYVDFNATDSTDPTKYRWSKWHGDKGATGAQGIQGPKGADGRTPYLHIAYANSADGRTGFSTSNTDNKRYLGTYTDYTQTDSTDPTKYKWVDMVGSVEVGGRNLYIISKASKGFISVYSEELGAQTSNNEYTSDFIPVSANNKYVFQGWVTVPEDGYPWHRYHYYDADKHKIGNPIMFESSTPLAGEQHYAEHIIVPNNANIAYIRISARLYEDGKLKLERGNISTDYSLAPEDIQADIDSKADQALTQQQLNALAEKNRNMEAEMAAKASLAEVERWKQAYDEYVAQNDADKTSAEQKLITLTSRVAEWVKDWEDKKVQWSFLDTNMDFGEEGLRLGKKGSPTSILISNDRIGFYSGGSEVASMSNGTLTIDNGIFAKSLQIGHYREEVYEGDKTINVIRWID